MDEALFFWLNQYAGWGYWSDWVAFLFGQYGIMIDLGLMAVRWHWPRRPRRHDRHAILLATAAIVFALGLAQVPGRFGYRERPYQSPGAFTLVQPEVAASSFPSSHAAAGFSCAVILGWRAPGWGALFWSVAILMAIARVYAALHYPTDVLAGALIGLLTGLTLLALRSDLEPALDRVLSVVAPGSRPEGESSSGGESSSPR